jgi:TPR repeat protein
MKGNFWTLTLSLFLAGTADAQQPAIPLASNALTTNRPGQREELRARAERGDAAAQYNLGVCYDDGEGVAQDHREAANWYRKSALQGYAEAQFTLGFCYQKGEGVMQDCAEAMNW